jgi:hypothetical protein
MVENTLRMVDPSVPIRMVHALCGNIIIKSGQLAVVSDVGFSLRVQDIDRAFGELGHVMSPDFRVGTKKASRKGLRKHNMACPEVLSRANQACGYKKQVSATLVT